MLLKLWCLIWGHKTVVKAYTGETYQTATYMGDQITVSLYRWEKQKWCIRCGAPSEVSR